MADAITQKTTTHALVCPDAASMVSAAHTILRATMLALLEAAT
jgi:hypothetical protein